MPNPSRGVRLAAAAAVLGGILRLGAAFYYWDSPLTHPDGDDSQYHGLATSAAAGNGFTLQGEPVAYRLPLHPIILAVGIKVLRTNDPGPLRLFQALLATAGLWLIFLIGCRLHSERAGAAAALLAALHPEQIFLPTSLYLESFYSLTLLLSAWRLLEWMEVPDNRNAGLLGISIGGSLLTRSVLAPLPVIVGVWILKSFPSRKTGLQQAALLIAFAYLPLAPWIARNAVQFGAFIPFECGIAGPVIYHATAGHINPPSDDTSIEPMRSMYRNHPQTEWNAIAFSEAKKAISARPARYALTTWLRVNRMWTDSYLPYLLHQNKHLAGWISSSDRRWDSVRWVDRVLRIALAAGALFLLTVFPNPKAWALFGFLMYFHIYAFGTILPRFTAPLTPIACLLAGAGLASWKRLNAAPLG